MIHAPIVNPHPPAELLDLLSGEAIERLARACPTCHGHSRLQVTSARDTRVCPTCRGTGERSPR